MSDREVVDGVVYVQTKCVDCGKPMSVSESALRTMRGLAWPKCSECVWAYGHALEHLPGGKRRPS